MTVAIQGILNASEIIFSYLDENPLVKNENSSIRHLHPIEERVYNVFVKHIIAYSPVLFLDIDGVLNSRSTEDLEIRQQKAQEIHKKLFPNVQSCSCYQTRRIVSELLEKKAVANLDQLLTSFPDMVIVLSSDWRKEQSIYAIRKIFETHFFSKRIIEKTFDQLPDYDLDHFCIENEACIDPIIIRNFRHRGAFIQHFLNEYSPLNFMVFDDIDQGSAFEEHFICIDPETLITEEDIQLATTVLSKIRIKETECMKIPLSQKVEKLEDNFKYYKILPTLNAITLLKSFAKHQVNEVISLVKLVRDRLDSHQIAFILLKIIDIKEARKFIPILFSIDLDPQEISDVLYKLLENQDTQPLIPYLLTNNNISFEKRQELIFLSLKKENNHFILKHLLHNTPNIHSQTKGVVLMQLIGIDGVAHLLLRDNDEDIYSRIKSLVASSFSDYSLMEELIILLLVNGDVTTRARGEVFEELSKRENCDESLIRLLKKGIDPYFLGQALLHLSKKNNGTKMIEQIILHEFETPPYSNGKILLHLSKNEGSNEVIKLLLKGKRVIPEEDRNQALSHLAERDGNEEVMFLLCKQKQIPLHTKVDCLLKIAARTRNYGINQQLELQLIDTLFGTKITTSEEYRTILMEYIKKVVGSNKALEILSLLLQKISIKDEENKKNERKTSEENLNNIYTYPLIAGEALIQLANQRAVETDPKKMFLLEQMIDVLNKTNISEIDKRRAFKIISSNKLIKKGSFFMSLFRR